MVDYMPLTTDFTAKEIELYDWFIIMSLGLIFINSNGVIFETWSLFE